MLWQHDRPSPLGCGNANCAKTARGLWGQGAGCGQCGTVDAEARPGYDRELGRIERAEHRGLYRTLALRPKNDAAKRVACSDA